MHPNSLKNLKRKGDEQGELPAAETCPQAEGSEPQTKFDAMDRIMRGEKPQTPFEKEMAKWKRRDADGFVSAWDRESRKQAIPPPKQGPPTVDPSTPEPVFDEGEALLFELLKDYGPDKRAETDDEKPRSTHTPNTCTN